MNREFERLIEEKWEKSLNSYATPSDFTKGTTMTIFENKGKNDVPFSWIYAPGYANRRKLMDVQKAEAEKRRTDGIKPRWTNDGNTSCFLCDNVGQAKDIGDNLILPWGNFEDYILVPNRYPAYVGDMLLVVKEHNKEGQEKQYFPAGYIPTGLEIAERYKLAFLRNHPRAGMSIPKHDHLQIKPTKVDSNLGKRAITQIIYENLSPTDYGEGIFRVDRTRFDTIALKGKKSLEDMIKLINNLRANEQIFTFYYHPNEEQTNKGVFYVSVFKAQDKNRRIGAGSPLYHEIKDTRKHPAYEELMQVPMEFLYAKGTFNWEKYF